MSYWKPKRAKIVVNDMEINGRGWYNYFAYMFNDRRELWDK